MSSSKNKFKFSPNIYLLVLFSGLAALSWEVLWQLKTSIALGVSSWGAAITIAVTMGGMSVGSLLMGQFLRNKKSVRPVRIYGILEIIVGCAGLLLISQFNLIERFDSWAYQSNPAQVGYIYIISIVAALAIPTMCLGATLPVIGLAAQQHKTPLSKLYGLNTLGASAGVLIAAFILIPLLGVNTTIIIVALVNLVIGVTALLIDQGPYVPKKPKKKAVKTLLPDYKSAIVVFVTGFSTFVLEIAWFRSLTASFFSTTVAFAIMLFSVLVALGLGARMVSYFKARNIALGALICTAGILILVATPLIERFDYISNATTNYQPIFLFYRWFLQIIIVMGAPMLLLGVALPWILDDQSSTRKWGALYSLNAFASIMGAIVAAWVLLPTIGFIKAAWLAGLLVLITGIFITTQKRMKFIALGAIALLISVMLDTGIGVKRVQITSTMPSEIKSILQTYNGPDVTASAVEHENGERTLVIDGFVATSQAPREGAMFAVQYMDWLGHLPMLLHSNPKDALVISFGTGQTANAVRKENPEKLDVVDINERVIDLAKYFSSNEKVLEDPRVNVTIMDGRAYLRRTQKNYDVITLEPMPPTFAGVNALYCKEFYEEGRAKMTPDGVIAQWLPFHLLTPYHSASIAKTFQDVFPNSILWLDTESGTGVLLGTKNDTRSLEEAFKGYNRAKIDRKLTFEQVKGGIELNRDELLRYGAFGDAITDDNQLLAYGSASYSLHKSVVPQEQMELSFELIRRVKDK